MINSIFYFILFVLGKRKRKGKGNWTGRQGNYYLFSLLFVFISLSLGVNNGFSNIVSQRHPSCIGDRNQIKTRTTTNK